MAPITQALFALKALAGAVIHPRAYFRLPKEDQPTVKGQIRLDDERICYYYGGVAAKVLTGLEVALKAADIHPDIKKIVVFNCPEQGRLLNFDNDGYAPNLFKSLFDVDSNNHAVLKEGGRACLILLSETRKIDGSFFKDLLFFMCEAQERLRQFVEGGNICTVVFSPQVALHFNTLWELPPQIEETLHRGKN